MHDERWFLMYLRRHRVQANNTRRSDTENTSCVVVLITLFHNQLTDREQFGILLLFGSAVLCKFLAVKIKKQEALFNIIYTKNSIMRSAIWRTFLFDCFVGFFIDLWSGLSYFFSFFFQYRFKNTPYKIISFSFFPIIKTRLIFRITLEKVRMHTA